MWRRRPETAVSLLEVIPSRWDDGPLERARTFLAGVTGVGILSLEFAATSDGVRFYLRAPSGAAMQQLQAHLGAAYPQAGLGPLGTKAHDDPAWRGPNEAMASVELHLTGDPGLPLKTNWRRQLDPLTAVLAAPSALAHGERIISQLVVGPAPQRWADGLRAGLAVPEPASATPYPAASGSEALPLVALLGVGALGLQGYLWYRAGEMATLLAAGVAAALGLPLAALLVARLKGRREETPAKLAEEKLAEPAFAVQLRLLAFAPGGTSRERLRHVVEQIAAAYGAYGHPGGSGLRARPWRGDPVRPRSSAALFGGLGSSTPPRSPHSGTHSQMGLGASGWPPGISSLAPLSCGAAVPSASQRTRATPFPSTCRTRSSIATSSSWPRRAGASPPCCCTWPPTSWSA